MYRIQYGENERANDDGLWIDPIHGRFILREEWHGASRYLFNNNWNPLLGSIFQTVTGLTGPCINLS